jgi:cobalt-zinc-cadmium efflux system protein
MPHHRNEHHHNEHHGHHGHHHHHHAEGRSAAAILTAFWLNLGFSVLELAGGLLTGSAAILSDALHDLGDAAGIGLAYALEKKSHRPPDDTHPNGYRRYSVLGGLLVTLILLGGSCAVLIHGVWRLLHPAPIHYDGMLLLALVGVGVNTAAALLTRRGDSLNRRAVSLHMLEDVLGWAVVLVGALVMKFTDLAVLDPLLSMGVAVFILVHSLENLREVADLFLERTPRGVDMQALREHLLEVEGVASIRELAVRSLDGERHEATLRLAVSGDAAAVKARVRAVLAEQGIDRATIETDER